MLAGIVASTILVGLTLLVHYEILRLAWALLPSLPFPVRLRVVFISLRHSSRTPSKSGFRRLRFTSSSTYFSLPASAAG